MNFDIKTEQVSDDAYVISLAGEVDLYTAPEFKQQLLEVIGQGGKDVIVDFTNTTFIDSTTLGVLVGGVKRLRSNDGQLSLVCSDRNITKIFEITGLDRVFTIYPSREEAVATIGASTTVVRAAARRCRSPFSRSPRLGLQLRRRAALVSRGAPTRRTASSCSPRSARACHTLAEANATRQGRAEPRRGLPASTTSRDSRSRPSARSSPTRSSSRATTAERARRCRRTSSTGEDVDDVAAYVAAVAGRAKASRSTAPPPPPARRRPGATPPRVGRRSDLGRGQEGVRGQRLRRVPHARAPRARPARSAPISTS